MSVLYQEEEADSPLFQPSSYVTQLKASILAATKLMDLPTLQSYKSTTDEQYLSVNLDILPLTPFKKQIKLTKVKRHSQKRKDNKSLVNIMNTSVQKISKQQRPLSGTNSILHKRQSLNIDDKRFLKSSSIRAYIRPFMPPVGLTAYSYIIMQINDHIHVSWNSKSMVQIASLTKIMTCFCILKIIKQYKQDRQQLVQIGMVQSSIIGTTARLKKGQRYSIHQLLYGLMLPSGNDASLALAVWAGKVLTMKGWRTKQISKKREAITVFVEYMNHVSKQLDLKKTRFANPHGLPSPDNKSTAYDIALLCRKAMQNVQFKTIVCTKQFCTYFFDQNNQRQQVIWKNTHKLLKKDCYLGVKTGVTATAGACLSSYLSINDRQFIIIVLNCKKLQKRFKQTQILRKWLFKKQGISKIQIDIDKELQQDFFDDQQLLHHDRLI